MRETMTRKRENGGKKTHVPFYPNQGKGELKVLLRNNIRTETKSDDNNNNNKKRTFLLCRFRRRFALRNHFFILRRSRFNFPFH
jgi:hypothetical protein